MNIDLLITHKSEAGLVTDSIFGFPLKYAVLDVDTSHIVLHGNKGESLRLNIALSIDIQNHLIKNRGIHVAHIDNEVIQNIIYIPIILTTSSDINVKRFIPRSRISTVAFEIFMRECALAQAVHREEIKVHNKNDGATQDGSGILHDKSLSVLKFSNSLSYQRKMEQSNNLSIGYAPTPSFGLGGDVRSLQSSKRTINEQEEEDSEDEIVTINPVSKETHDSNNPMSFFAIDKINKKINEANNTDTPHTSDDTKKEGNTDRDKEENTEYQEVRTPVSFLDLCDSPKKVIINNDADNSKDTKDDSLNATNIKKDIDKKLAQLILDADIPNIVKPIHNLIGMQPLKDKIESIAYLAQTKALRSLNDLPNTPIAMHMVFTGPPGTGKTTAAREIAHILKEMHYLSKGHLVETSPDQMSQHRDSAQEIIKSAIGGVLFIDEAYSFLERDWQKTTSEIAVLLKMMEDHRDELVVIVAGYKSEMRRFIQSNPGLESRFSMVIDFPNYSPNEMIGIFEKMCVDNDYIATNEAIDKIRKFFQTFSDNDAIRAFGNGRGVRNIFEKSLLAQSSRVMQSKITDFDSLRTIEASDVLSEEDRFQEISQQELEELLMPLNNMVGLKKIKEEIHDLVYVLQAYITRRRLGLATPSIVLHSLFLGPPGTGKTSVARIMGKIYKRLGFLTKGHVVEVDQSKLIGKYIGFTTNITREVFEEAEGGILFIDEAYTLTAGEWANDYGHEALTTILKLMEDKRQDVIVICAGYEKEMENFIKSNSGLESRFPRRLMFKAYTTQELIEIFYNVAKQNNYNVSDKLLDALQKHLESLSEEDINKLGNARYIRNIFEKTIINQSRRIALSDISTPDDILKIIPEDIGFPEKKKEERFGFV